uniref:Uncharacterized protein n=1 Tax=Triticum urartu TaxID=4572 RepID=A0A8R7TZ65_TRIUA
RPAGLADGEPAEHVGDEADLDRPLEPVPLLPALSRAAAGHVDAAVLAEQVGRGRGDGRERAADHARGVPGRAGLRLPDERHRARLRPVVPERRVGPRALLGEQPLVELAALLDPERALRHHGAERALRPRHLAGARRHRSLCVTGSSLRSQRETDRAGGRSTVVHRCSGSVVAWS